MAYRRASPVLDPSLHQPSIATQVTEEEQIQQHTNGFEMVPYVL